MIMTNALIAAEPPDSGKPLGKVPELSLHEIAALLRGKLPPPNARSCLDQLPFIPVRSKASGN